MNLIEQYLKLNPSISESERIQVQLAIEFCGDQLLGTIKGQLIAWPSSADSQLWNERVENLNTEVLKQFNLLEI